MDKTQTKKLWFKRKKYGWGWIPVSWEGWMTLSFYLILVLSLLRSVDIAQGSTKDILINFLPRIIILTAILIVICYKKGETPKWTWGEEKTEVEK